MESIDFVKANMPEYVVYPSPAIMAADLPASFPDPFDPVPHEVAVLAAHDLQKRITKSKDLNHCFGFEEGIGSGVGKMFGVLVIRTPEGKTGYLSAFSGKLQSGTQVPGFVPPVFDTLDKDGFYLKGEGEINVLNRRITALESQDEYKALLSLRDKLRSDALKDLQHAKKTHDDAKKSRAEVRLKSESLPEDERMSLMESLEKESMRHHYLLKDRKKHWRRVVEELELSIQEAEKDIIELKEKRKEMSAALQQKLFENYSFLNAAGKSKNLADIFHTDKGLLPPSGAGECTAPKLLHFAFRNKLEPIALAEFWWGISPSSEIRRHGQYYPACHTKCRPILSHMLSDNIITPAETNYRPQDLPILMEDDHMLLINKPAGLLAVPGKGREASVYSMIREKYPEATGPLIVHRLDMATSGIMLIAKSMEVYHHLQRQFIRRTVQKRYSAILEGTVPSGEGIIDLPLRVDLDDRPRQMVCHSYGKQAVTRYKVLRRESGKTWVHFFPLTGRTHQLRVHAAYKDGLDTPIAGDDLYGQKSDRLYLHADRIQFMHPVSGQMIIVECEARF